MRLLALIYRRLAVFALGAFSVWLIVFVFRITDSRAPTILALSLVYALAAYVLLPRIVRMSLKILQRKSVPSFTLTGDGFPGDPVNLVLMGEFDKLRAAFLAAGWTEAEPLNLASSWRMVVAFVLNRSYPAAPFSTLFLFGRAQDVGFQKAIDMSPRKRHHVRFWALSLERNDEPLNNPEFWLNADRPPIDDARALGGRRNAGHGPLLHQVHLPVHPRDRGRRQRRARFHHFRAQKDRRHRRRGVATRRGNACRPRQSLRDGWGCGGGETELRDEALCDKAAGRAPKKRSPAPAPAWLLNRHDFDPAARADPAGHDPACQADDDRGEDRRPEPGDQEAREEPGDEHDHQRVDDEQEQPEREQRDGQGEDDDDRPHESVDDAKQERGGDQRPGRIERDQAHLRGEPEADCDHAARIRKPSMTPSCPGASCSDRGRRFARADAMTGGRGLAIYARGG